MTLSARSKAYIALIANAVIWGSALPIVKPALELITPFEFLFLRYLVGLIVTLPFFIWLLIIYKPSLLSLITIGIIEMTSVGIANGLLYAGLGQTSSIEAGLITSTAPIFIALSGVIVLKEKVMPRELIGMIIALVAVCAITLEPILTKSNTLSISSFAGNLLVLGHNLFWMAYVVLAKKFYPQTPKMLIGFTGLISGSVFYLTYHVFNQGIPNFPFVDYGLILNSYEVLLAVLYMGILGSAIAVPLYVYGNNLIETSEASLFVYLQPLVYIPLSYFWLQEPISTLLLITIILSALGVTVASWQPKAQKNLRRRS